MSDKKPVILYGASGFSGRLVAEFLREYNVPFIAAGRNRKKIEEVMNRVPGIETADYEVAEIGNSATELANLFSGAKVVCNTVGPFLYHGPRVVEACLQAGCHYVDISGEQAWIRDVAENWGAKFAQRGLLVAPATAYMSATSDIAAHFCIEVGGIDTLEVVSLFKGIPTFGSTQTIFAVIQTEAFYLEQNRYKPWQRATGHEAVIPGSIETQLASTLGRISPPCMVQKPSTDCKRQNHRRNSRPRSNDQCASDRKTLRRPDSPAAEGRAGKEARRDGKLGTGRNSSSRKCARTTYDRRRSRTRHHRIRPMRDIRRLLLQTDWPDSGLRSSPPGASAAAQGGFRIAGRRVRTSRTPSRARGLWPG